MLFANLSIGDVFKWGDSTFVKIGEFEQGKRMPDQYPDSIKLSNMHYCVLSGKAPVVLIKSKYNYPPENMELEEEEDM